MLRKPRTLLVILALALGASSSACGGGTQIDAPREQAVTTTTSGLEITSAISAVSLGGYAANVQIAFKAEAATSAANVEVMSVVLVDATSGSVVDTLKASSPQVWNGSTYVPWNQQIAPGGDLKASYNLTVPSWSTLDPSGSRSSSAYSRSYKLRVTLRIDGVEVLLQSASVNREPEIQT